jgi:peptidyl-prolyl cis-trans isomerase B (cyclophilin B)
MSTMAFIEVRKKASMTKILFFLALILVLFPILHSFAQLDDRVVIFDTKSGRLVIELFPKDSPKTVENFINLTESGFYDRTIFHRVIKGFMIQGGDPFTKPGAYESTSQWGTGDPGYKIDAEFNNIKHNAGIVSMARSSDPNSAGSQFFIVHKDSNFLDGQYTVFGRLATQESYETLEKIATLETAANDIPLHWGEGEILKSQVVKRSEVPDILELGEPERVTQSEIPQTIDGKYSSEKFGFSIEFPIGWVAQEIESTNPVIPNVAAVEPSAAGIPASISILVENSNGRSLTEFLDEWKNQYLQSSIDAGNLQILSEEKTTINGLEAVVSDVTGIAFIEDGTVNLEYRETAIASSDKFYRISYTSIEEEFEKNLENYENSLKTFTILSKPNDVSTDGGGCLIATAAFGSEIASQVQQLRETRDNVLLKTESGKFFLTNFNQFYYSFSPTIADLERQNPIFKETVKVAITPLLTSLSILNYVDIDSEAEMLGYGISIILIIIGMYFIAPAMVIHGMKKRIFHNYFSHRDKPSEI